MRILIRIPNADSDPHSQFASGSRRAKSTQIWIHINVYEAVFCIQILIKIKMATLDPDQDLHQRCGFWIRIQQVKIVNQSLAPESGSGIALR